VTRRGKLIALGIVLILGVPVSLPFVWRYQGKRELRRTLESLKARGEKLTVKELAPPRPTDSENGYLGLLTIVTRLPKINLPPAPFVAPGKRAVLTTTTRWTNYSAGRMDTWEDVAIWRDSARDILLQAQAGLRKPVFFANHDYSLGFNLMLTDLTHWKRLAQSFALAALDHARTGNRQGALENLRAGFRVNAVLREERVLIGQLVCIAADTIMLDALWHCLHCHNWSEAELAEMLAMLPPRGHVEGMVRALEMERFMGRYAADALRKGREDVWGLLYAYTPPQGPTNLTEFLDQVTKDPGELLLKRPMAEFWRFAHLDASEAHYLNSIQAMIDNARVAAAARSMAEVDLEFTERMLIGFDSGDRYRYLLSSLLLPSLHHPVVKSFRFETHRSLTEAGVALHWYRKKHGRWPAALADLVPAFLNAVPIDYADGKPLRYRLKEDGSFVLYSVGEPRPDSSYQSSPTTNETVRAVALDEGGDPTPYETSTTYRDIWSGRDVVWPKPATREEIEAYEAKRRKQQSEEP
jgi:hypothetical protein